MPRDLVGDADLQTALVSNLQGWKVAGARLERTFEFPSFRLAMEFVQEVAESAEQLNHHPDIDIRYKKVAFSLTSHDVNGITFRDLALAGKISEFADNYEHPDRLRTA